MSLKPSAAPFTYDDYAALPADGRRWELIDGEFEVTPAPAPCHQTVSRRLQFELMRVLEESDIAQVFDAPLDVILAPTQVVQPDLAILAKERSHLVSKRGIEGPPDIVVEILSPSTSVLDRRVKKGVYARFGVPEYWIVEPSLGHIELFRLVEGAYVIERRFDRASRLTTPSFPQVDINLARVFRE